MKLLVQARHAGLRSLLLAGSFAAPVAHAQPAVPSQNVPPPSPQEAARQASPQAREEWQRAIARVPQPRKGCFTAAFPSMEWREVGCVTAPSYPQPPRRGARPEVVGNANDISAQAPSGHISEAIGSFDSVTGVTSESSPIGNTGPQVPNAYTLQMNTNFMSGVCVGSPNAGCQGWQQFVFENTGTVARAFIQYWLIKYNAPCPGGASWNQFSFSGSTDIYCFKNNVGGAVGIPLQPISNLANLTLTGTVGAGGDSVVVHDGANAYARVGDNAVNAAAGWTIAEFNVFGDGGNSSGGGQAVFNAGASIVTRTRIIYGGTAAPTCTTQGFTGETNNLSFGPTAPASSAPGPAIAFAESTGGGATSNCAAATAIGDTHLKTFAGLFYDFQATGDFLLAQTGADFQVQTRQVSGAPNWPNAAVNKAVAVQSGRSRVAVCQNGVTIDGRPARLADGQPIALPEGGDVLRRGNTVLVHGPEGDSMRAVLNSGYIDVSVGLGRWPAKVIGLLADSAGKPGQVAARDGTVLSSPFSFEALYGRYGEGWRVPARDSMLMPCGREVVRSRPQKPFFAADLNVDFAKRSEAICTRAQVKRGPLFDACMIDVAVLGAQAAKIYVGAAEPAMVGDARR